MLVVASTFRQQHGELVALAKAQPGIKSILPPRVGACRISGELLN